MGYSDGCASGNSGHISVSGYRAGVVDGVCSGLGLAHDAAHAVGAAHRSLVPAVTRNYIVVHISLGIATLYAGTAYEAADTGVTAHLAAV